MSDLKETKAEETKTEETCSHKPANVCGSSPFAAEDADQEATQMTCDVLCSLSSLVHQKACERDASSETTSESIKQRGSGKSCPKQLQLPMFLSSKSDTNRIGFTTPRSFRQMHRSPVDDIRSRMSNPGDSRSSFRVTTLLWLY
jgi:hypothetical protein